MTLVSHNLSQLKSQHFRLLLVIYLLGIVPVILGAQFLIEKGSAEQLHSDRQLIEENLDSTLDFYQFIPELMNQSELLIQALRHPTTDTIDQLNERLLQINRRLASDAIYLMDTDGNTLSSSNFDQPGSFIGDNFSFRPYFYDAITGERGSYLALGVKSGQRGYYFSAPISDKQKKLGVLVVKVSLNFIEDIWRRTSSEFLVYDNDGIVFFSSRSDWLYSSLFQLSSVSRQRLQASQRYGQRKLNSISPLNTTNADTLKHIQLWQKSSSKTVGDSQSWRISAQHIAKWDLNVATLTPAVKSYLGLIYYCLGYTLFILLLWFYWLYRRKNKELQHYLATMNSSLEKQVNALTSNLRQSNTQLQLSVDHHRQALADLEQTQAELVQTAKLAVLGEFSAGLHHELAQPLQALKTYSENGLRMLQLNKTQMLEDNLREIASVVLSMSSITQQFKVFARRNDPEPRPVGLKEIITGALSIVRPKLEKQQVNLINNTDDTMIYCEPILIEQVLVNLISNAIHALGEIPTPEIHLSGEEQRGKLLLHVTDNGPSVEPSVLENLFEPFFTTRKGGLGLGLAIARRIVENQQGEISVQKNCHGPGLKFTVSLPLYCPTATVVVTE